MHAIIQSVSSRENLTLFQMARAGIRYNPALLERSGISRKQYYKALRVLRDAGLVRKFESRYFHTTLGKLVYQEILKIEKYADYENEMKMIDILKDSGQFSQNDMSAFIKKVSNKKQDESLLDIATDDCATHYP
jgi:Fe2+ or Zn2+ uptake regulation protein